MVPKELGMVAKFLVIHLMFDKNRNVEKSLYASKIKISDLGFAKLRYYEKRDEYSIIHSLFDLHRSLFDYRSHRFK